MPAVLAVMLSAFHILNRLRLVLSGKRILHIDSFLHAEDTVPKPDFILKLFTNLMVEHIAVGITEHGNQLIERLPSPVMENRKRQHNGNLSIVVTPLQCTLNFLALNISDSNGVNRVKPHVTRANHTVKANITTVRNNQANIVFTRSTRRVRVFDSRKQIEIIFDNWKSSDIPFLTTFKKFRDLIISPTHGKQHF